MVFVIAVDGPTAAGKTTTSRRIASEFGLSYLESGRTYRYVAYVANRAGVDVADEGNVAGVVEHILERREYQDVLAADDREVRYLRSPEVTRAVSRVAAVPKLRSRVTDIIRSWAHAVGFCVIEGRDIGTVVFPDALVKIFLTASPEIRARRRYVQEAGQSYEDVLTDLLRRDQADSTRKHSPLTPAVDAYKIDTSEKPIDAVVHEVAELCRSRRAAL